MFSLWGVDCGNMTGYQDAVKVWENKPTWRGEEGEHDRRSIRDPNKRQGGKQRYLTVRKCADSSIAFEYHSTDVVTYMPDNTVVLQPYTSMGTDTFMRGCAPLGMHSHFNNPNFNLLKCSEAGDSPNHWCSLGSIWDVNNGAVLRRTEAGTWIPEAGSTTPFTFPTLKRGKARAALKKYPYADLRCWLTAATQLGAVGMNIMRGRPSPSTIVQWLEAREFSELLCCCDWNTTVERWGCRRTMARPQSRSAKILTGVRHAIYEVEGAVDTEERPFLSSWDEVRALIKLQATYAWL